MRILFTTTAGMGHFHPLVPLAQAAMQAGHAVAFACPGSFCARVEASGFQAFSVVHDGGPDPERGAAMQRVMRLPMGMAANLAILADVYIGISARRVLPELAALCRRWAPDVVVREEREFGGAIVAEQLGLPHAAVQVSYFYNLQGSPPPVGQRLDELRASVGLPPDPSLDMLYRYLFLSFDPPALLDPAVPRPPTLHHLRPDVFDRSGVEELPPWWAEPLARPVIYATLGTEAAKIPGFFPAIYQTILRGLQDQGGTVVLTIGRDQDPAALGPQPQHVHVEPYIPQSLLLPHCDVVITHGGHNTVLAALSHGLPVVVVPFFADQMDNAARCIALDVGRVVASEDLAPETVGAAVSQVLSDQRYRTNAVQLRADMHALPGLAQGVRLLEQLVSARTPILTP